jgi:3-methyladenine DNA glycosylase/8-oxoguanine DNA glycosylase
VHDSDGFTTIVRPALPTELRLTLAPLRRGAGDPAMVVDRTGAWWRATRTPLGPATTRLARAADGISVTAWGPGAEWAVAAAPELLGRADDLDGFRPAGLVGELHQRMPGLRVPRSLAVFETLVPAVLEQKVVGAEARAAWRGLLRSWGTPAPAAPAGAARAPGPPVVTRPAPAGAAAVPALVVPPSPAALRAVPGWAFHRLGVELKRANTIRMAATYGSRLDALAELDNAEAARRLCLLPGVGPWTAAEVGGVALGDADAVPVGDYHLPNMVSWALAGEPRGTDDRMLELLEPYAGHRGRVLRLLSAGGLYAPRYGPRMPKRLIQRH